MKSITTLLFVIFAFALNVQSQCYLETLTCRTLKATLENVPEQLLTLPKNVPSEKKPGQELTLLTFSLEQEIATGIWKKLKQVKTNATSALFENLGKGTYRVTSIANNSVGKTRTKVHQHEKGFDPKFDGFSSNVVQIGSCERLLGFGTTSVEDNISIYPNPTKDIIHISGIPADNGTVTALLYDLNGRPLLEKGFDTGAFQLKVPYILEGVYFLKLKSADNEVLVTKKITIVR